MTCMAHPVAICRAYPRARRDTPTALYSNGRDKKIPPRGAPAELRVSSSNQGKLPIAVRVRTSPAGIERVVFAEERCGPRGELLR